MSEADRDHLAQLISKELQASLRMFRPRDARVAQVYDHVVESDLRRILLAPRMSKQDGVDLNEWFRAWREGASELVTDYVDVEYSEAELREIQARIAHAMMSLELDEQARDRLLEDFERELEDD